MNEKFNKNAKVDKFTNMLGIAVRLLVIDPLCTWAKGYWLMSFSVCWSKYLSFLWSCGIKTYLNFVDIKDEELFLLTRQSMFVKHVPPLWAYFIEATKLYGKQYRSLNSCKIWWTWIISTHAYLNLWCNTPANFHSNPCNNVAGVEKTS